MPSQPLLDVRGLTRRFGGVTALDGLDVAVAPGEIRAAIGPNGARKSMLFELLAGVLRPSAGSMRLNGTDVGGLPAHRRARRGIARTFQTPQVLGQMSVLDNVLVGRHICMRAGLIGALLRNCAALIEETANRRTALEILDRLGLGAFAA